jgi:hypothetical protein
VSCYKWLRMGFGLVIGLIEPLQIVTTSQLQVTLTLSLIHTHYKSLLHGVLSVCGVFTGCLVTASHVVAPSASVFTSLLAGDCLTTNSMLLHNGIKHRERLRLPCLHQGRQSAMTSDLDWSVWMQTLSRLSTDFSRLRLACVSILQIYPLHGSTETMLPTIPLLLHDVTADTDVTCSSVVCKRSRGHAVW